MIAVSSPSEIADPAATPEPAPKRITAWTLARPPSIAAQMPVLAAIVLTAYLATAALRIVVGAAEPLWLDEAWTGLHASQPTFAAFLREVYVDINAPLYYVAMWAWAALFGLSNEALRFPSLAIGLAAPLLALLAARSLDRPTRLIWCGLLASWTPGIWQAQEARCYTLLFALCAAGTILHIRLLAKPGLGRAAAWAGVGALAILTHYYAVLLFGCQGLAFLAACRGRAFRTWPSALLFLPAFGWMAYHLPQLIGFAEVNWYTTLQLSALPWLFLFAAGPAPVVLGVMAAGIPGTVFGVEVRRAASPLAWTVGATLAATAILVATGFVRPSFTPRYLTLMVPGLMLGLAAWAASVARARPWAPGVLLFASLAWAAFWSATIGASAGRVLNYQTASEHLMREGVETVAFAWDNPSAWALPADKTAELGSFFFRRAGNSAEVRGVVLGSGKDPNAELLATVRGARRPGLIWIYDKAVPGTLGIAHPPAIEARDPSWSCRDFGRLTITILACVRRG